MKVTGDKSLFKGQWALLNGDCGNETHNKAIASIKKNYVYIKNTTQRYDIGQNLYPEYPYHAVVRSSLN